MSSEHCVLLCSHGSNSLQPACHAAHNSVVQVALAHAHCVHMLVKLRELAEHANQRVYDACPPAIQLNMYIS